MKKPFQQLSPLNPPTLYEDGLEFAPNDTCEFQTGSGIIIEKVKFSEMRKHGFLNIVRKRDGVVMCQVIQPSDEQKIEKILSHTKPYKNVQFVTRGDDHVALD